ncbi:hypothetical protein AVEN_223499-1 [Araneus ventricosus]|uniref:Uncharacterized protein n=1 Tax=Araneus ventricosus TaxID=182803 RepID=A0A4Y2DK61_ARAVE|nr:hypothetical protein AVEN_223499-1 [Araneus ventricosus]
MYRTIVDKKKDLPISCTHSCIKNSQLLSRKIQGYQSFLVGNDSTFEATRLSILLYYKGVELPKAITIGSQHHCELHLAVFSTMAFITFEYQSFAGQHNKK